MTMVTDEEVDNFAREVEKAILQGEKYLEDAPEFPPRPGKYETPDTVVPANKLREALHGR